MGTRKRYLDPSVDGLQNDRCGSGNKAFQEIFDLFPSHYTSHKFLSAYWKKNVLVLVLLEKAFRVQDVHHEKNCMFVGWFFDKATTITSNTICLFYTCTSLRCVLLDGVKRSMTTNGFVNFFDVLKFFPLQKHLPFDQYFVVTILCEFSEMIHPLY